MKNGDGKMKDKTNIIMERLISEEKSKEIVNNLNRKFNIEPCRLVAKPYLEYGGYGCYNHSHRTIFLPYKSLKESVILHEYAHHLALEIELTKRRISRMRKGINDYKKKLKTMDFQYDKRYASLKTTRSWSWSESNSRRRTKVKRKQHHGKKFVRALKNVLLAHYGNLESYKPDNEYKTVMKLLKQTNGQEVRDE